MKTADIRKRTKQLIAEAQSDSQRELAEILDALAEALDASGTTNAPTQPKASPRTRSNSTKGRGA